MLANVIAGQISGIGFLQKPEAGIVAQFEIHLAITGIDRNHFRGAMLQHAVAESPGRRADIKTNLALRSICQCSSAFSSLRPPRLT